jgi:hypothetical protein
MIHIVTVDTLPEVELEALVCNTCGDYTYITDIQYSKCDTCGGPLPNAIAVHTDLSFRIEWHIR